MFRFLLILFLSFFAFQLTSSQVQADSNAVIYGWRLDQQSINPITAEIDTILLNFQNHNFIFRKYHSITTLGSYGSPYVPNSFFQRNYEDDLLFMHMYHDYFNTYDNTLYINTRKPFTHLQYIFNWPKSNREEYFNAFHSQNITEKLNFGFDVNIIADKAHYRYINTNSKAFNIFLSYTGNNYNLHTSFNLNRFYSGENGGVVDTSYYSDWQFTKEIETYFTGGGQTAGVSYEPDVTNKIRYTDAMISQSLKLFSIGGGDSLSTSSAVAAPIVSHVFKVRRAAKIYENIDEVNNQYYNNLFSNVNETYDSTAEFKVSNVVQLDFKTRLKSKVLAGVYSNIGHEYRRYSYYTLLDSSLVDSTWINSIDTTGLSSTELVVAKSKYTQNGVVNYDTIYDINHQRSMSNVYVSAGIYGKFWTHLESRFTGYVYLFGYKAGQTKIDGLINTNINILHKPYQLYVYGSLENTVPSYQLNNYYSNHYVWEENFNSINKVFLSSKIAAPSNRFEIEGNYALFSNYIYITDSMPAAYTKPISITALTLEKEFIVWKFHSYNKLTYQVSENRNVIEVPSLLFYTSTYFDHTWRFNLTEGQIRTMIGFDINYNSGFNGYNYIPALAMFYQQGNPQTAGNYPYLDLWLNLRLKRTRFFLKFEHINSSVENKDYYYAVNYPAKIRSFKFGLSWTFYD
jgi:hypothetical protein